MLQIGEGERRIGTCQCDLIRHFRYNCPKYLRGMSNAGGNRRKSGLVDAASGHAAAVDEVEVKTQLAG